MFSSTYYEKLDPLYCKALQKLESDITYERVPPTYQRMLTISSCELIQEFASNYLTPKTLLQMIWKREITSSNIPLFNMMFHFLYLEDIQKDLSYIHIPRSKLMDKRFDGGFSTSIKLEDLCFPHNLLEYYLSRYEGNSVSHIPKKIIKRNFDMRKLYEKIKSFEENEEEEWINAMAETDDIEFVKQNIEYKLGQDLTNKKLWILYIKYLKEYDIQELLNVYSKYCRFFVNDHAMKEEYKAAAEKYGKITVPWKNAFDFEICDENLRQYKAPEIEKNMPINNTRCPIHFDSSQNIMHQKFPFHANLMSYIAKNAKAYELLKLNFSCKFFYHKYRIPVCYSLYIDTAFHSCFMSRGGSTTSPYRFKEETLIFHSNTLNEVDLNNIYISTKFSYRHYKIPLRNIIPKLYKCDSKFIDITTQELTFDEFKFFIGHGNVSSLSLNRVKLIDEKNGKDIMLEDILALTPKLRYLSVFNITCTSKTAQKLCELPFEYKIMRLDIRHETNLPLDPDAFGEFINKNASPDCHAYIYGAGDEDSFFADRLQSVVNNYWKNDDHKPYLEISGFE